MYAVIFKATVNTLDEAYFTMAKRMRQLAMEEYGCIEFTAVTEGEEEIAISYWESKEDIAAWKKNMEHLAAQKLGQSIWYKSYTVEIVEVLRRYKGKK